MVFDGSGQGMGNHAGVLITNSRTLTLAGDLDAGEVLGNQELRRIHIEGLGDSRECTDGRRGLAPLDLGHMRCADIDPGFDFLERQVVLLSVLLDSASDFD